jgi:hypothetical protein
MVIIIYRPGGGATGPSAFSLAPRRPAGEVSSEPQFTLYLGTNSGPYQTTENGTVILPPIPIEWIIAPRNVTAGQCPTRANNLALFGITNAIAAALVLVLGCRPLVRFLTRGLLGQPSKYSPYWTWSLSFAMQVVSNVVVSHLIVSTPGYEHLSMLNVFALYSARPRLNQILTGLLRIFVGPISIKGSLAVSEKPKRTDELPARSNSPRFRYDEYLRWQARQAGTSSDSPTVEWIYTDSYVATSVGELFLQLVSAIFIGVTWRRFPNDPIREHMKDYVNFMLAAPVLTLVGWLFVPIWLRRSRGLWRHESVLCLSLITAVFFMAVPGFFTYGVAWRYWDEFLTLPGSL